MTPTELAAGVGSLIRWRSADYLEMTKPRLNFMVLVTVGVGFLLGATGAVDWGLLVHTLIGVGLLSGGGAALNEYLERDLDARMKRTQDRPLPAGRLFPAEALAFGVACCAIGTVQLWFFVNPLTALLGLLSAGVYLFAYTPLKLRTPLNTVVGAVSGALPPMMGWTAVAGRVDLGAWLLFAILFMWQLPHFFAIAWFYREDYANAGMKMLSVVDDNGRVTRRTICGCSLAMLAVSLLPVFSGLSGALYLAAALPLGAVLLFLAVRLAVGKTHAAARRLFLASLMYLPLLLGAMVLDRILL